MSKKALCIGMNYPTSNQNRLTGCVADAGSMASLMLDLGVQSDNISLMIDETNFNKSNYTLMSVENKNKLYDSTTSKWKVNNNVIDLPTKKNILKKIDDICSDSSVNMLFMSVSSHGTYGTDKYGKETDGKSEIICALDDTGKLSSKGYLYDYELLNAIVIATKKRANSPIAIYFVIDICHSGSIANLHNILTISKTPNNTNLLITTDPSDSNTELNDNVYIALFSGCQDNQLSSENNISLMSRAITIRGYMTRAFEMSIRAKLNTSNYSCFDIYNNIINNMVQYLNGVSSINNNSNNQLPNFSTNKNVQYNSSNKTIQTMKFMMGSTLQNDILMNNQIPTKWTISREQSVDSTNNSSSESSNSSSSNSSSSNSSSSNSSGSSNNDTGCCFSLRNLFN